MLSCSNNSTNKSTNNDLTGTMNNLRQLRKKLTETFSLK